MSYAHEYPGHDDHEHTETIDGTEYRVSAVGGGTVGRSYGQNHWHYAVVSEGVVVDHGSDLSIGASVTHAEAAHELAAFFGDES